MRQEREDKQFQPLPRLEAGEYLVAILFEVGPAQAAGMGSSTISHQEIACWQALIGIDLEPWEVRLLRRLSAAYCKESQDAVKRDCPAPWNPVSYGPAQKDIGKSMRGALTALEKL